eukprot:CAMPEP_0178376770 /NCGR_PEP_ID=MMETSP0689_2-20121128/3574_1 /TAXON_ID=160604 /ORGANISM="Amphidinium massartii, Strain CS-259" /LENGTH=121 /DNA_ID=CAMNT_0019996803 /DNA_START=304 /DNA_END=668 /DNA_ORIENTATION=-
MLLCHSKVVQLQLAQTCFGAARFTWVDMSSKAANARRVQHDEGGFALSSASALAPGELQVYAECRIQLGWSCCTETSTAEPAGQASACRFAVCESGELRFLVATSTCVAYWNLLSLHQNQS